MDTVSQIKQKLDIVDVVAGYLSVKKSGKNYKALCPFHSEDTPSFMISPELQIFKCFGCGEAGDIFTFVEKMEGVDFNSALETLADKAGIKIERGQYDPNYKKKGKVFNINLMAAEFYHHLLTKHKAGKKALEYLKKKRGLDKKTIDAFKLGYAPNTWDTLYRFLHKKGYKDEDLLLSGAVIPRKSEEGGFVDKFRGRIIFPFFDVSGKVVGFGGRDIVGRDPKYLNTQETLVFNKSAFLYGLDKARVDIKKEGVVFVEGPMDVIKAWQNDITNVVAASGTSLTSVQLKMVSRYTKEITFCFDSDEAGLNSTLRALSLAEPFDFDVKVAMIPESYADLDDYLKKSPGAAKKVLKNPVPIYDFYFAGALKRFNKETAYGKKKIVEFLVPFFSKISNNVVLDHYVKQLSEEIKTGEEAIRGALKSPAEFEAKTDEELPENGEFQKEMKKSPEDYLLALFFKAKLDTLGQFLYKLDSDDFAVERNRRLFEEIKKYKDSKPKEFDIKYFTEKIDPNLKDFTLELYLWDLGDLTSNRILFAKEIESTISRIEKNSIKRKLKTISEQIKLAELEKDTKRIEDLSREFSDLSKKLI
jgi:DNA primase